GVLGSFTASQLRAVCGVTITCVVGVFSLGLFVGRERAGSEWTSKYKVADEIAKAVPPLKEQLTLLKETRALDIARATEEFRASLSRIHLGADDKESGLLDVRNLVASTYEQLVDGSSEYKPDSFWAVPTDSKAWSYSQSTLDEWERRLFNFTSKGSLVEQARTKLITSIIGDTQIIPTKRIHVWTKAESSETQTTDTTFVSVQRASKAEFQNQLDVFWNRHGKYLDNLMGAHQGQLSKAMASLGKADPLQMVLMLEFSRRALISSSAEGVAYKTQSIQKVRDPVRGDDVLYVRFVATINYAKESADVWDEIIVVPCHDDIYLIRSFAAPPIPDQREAIAAVRDWISRFRILRKTS
ncbi:MAG: hypothetical protein HZA46_20570, partial [Planctomycetales bacterium]|nr:hypothetical protein [Planctomycetales bacterium]